MVGGFTTACSISAYIRLNCEFEPNSGEVYSIQRYLIKFVSDLRNKIEKKCTLDVLWWIIFKCNCFLSIGLVDWLRKIWQRRTERTVTPDDWQWYRYFDCYTGETKPSVYWYVYNCTTVPNHYIKSSDIFFNWQKPLSIW